MCCVRGGNRYFRGRLVVVFGAITITLEISCTQSEKKAKNVRFVESPSLTTYLFITVKVIRRLLIEDIFLSSFLPLIASLYLKVNSCYLSHGK